MNWRFKPWNADIHTLAGMCFRLGGITCRGGVSRRCSFPFARVIEGLEEYELPEELDSEAEEIEVDGMDSDFDDANEYEWYV